MAVGFAMNARGSTEVILATIGLTMGVLNQPLINHCAHGRCDDGMYASSPALGLGARTLAVVRLLGSSPLSAI